MEKGLELGADFFMEKPFKPEMLLSKIQEVLGAKSWIM